MFTVGADLSKILGWEKNSEKTKILRETKIVGKGW